MHVDRRTGICEGVPNRVECLLLRQMGMQYVTLRIPQREVIHFDVKIFCTSG